MYIYTGMDVVTVNSSPSPTLSVCGSMWWKVCMWGSGTGGRCVMAVLAASCCLHMHALCPACRVAGVQLKKWWMDRWGREPVLQLSSETISYFPIPSVSGKESHALIWMVVQESHTVIYIYIYIGSHYGGGRLGLKFGINGALFRSGRMIYYL